MIEKYLNNSKIRLNGRTSFLSSIYLFFLSIVLYSCSKDKVTIPSYLANEAFVMTQQALDAAVFVSEARDTLITGNPFGSRELEAQGNFRSIFSTANKNEVQQSGQITVNWNYTNVNGRPGRPLFVDVMVKQAPGYNTPGNDFEYMRIPYEPSVNYSEHPNGMLPDVSNTNLCGLGVNILSVNCVTCHSRTSDLIFYDDLSR